MKDHMDQITDCSVAYIQEWQRLRAEREAGLVNFHSIRLGGRFTLPGGKAVQVKVSPIRAEMLDGTPVPYRPWELVAPTR